MWGLLVTLGAGPTPKVRVSASQCDIGSQYFRVVADYESGLDEEDEARSSRWRSGRWWLWATEGI